MYCLVVSSYLFAGPCRWLLMAPPQPIRVIQQQTSSNDTYFPCIPPIPIPTPSTSAKARLTCSSDISLPAREVTPVRQNRPKSVAKSVTNHFRIAPIGRIALLNSFVSIPGRPQNHIVQGKNLQFHSKNLHFECKNAYVAHTVPVR